MVRVIVLTSVERGFASLCIPQIATRPGIEIAMVVLDQGPRVSTARRLRRVIRKVLRIGVLGAINGVRMRPWFSDAVADLLRLEKLDDVCERHGVPLRRTNGLSGVAELIRESDAHVGLALGSGYIPKSVFTAPPHGFVNVHHEVLPDYRGAQSVIWQIHDGSRETGYTIHLIDQKIDHGAIIRCEREPVEFRGTLKETVAHTVANLWAASARTLADVVQTLPRSLELAKPQSDNGSPYTTPSFWQYLRMARMHGRLSTTKTVSRVETN